MLNEKINAIYQKIHFIERDMELHKTILANIPFDNKREIEETIGKIAQLKNSAVELKKSIQEVDSEEYERVQKLEVSTAKFREIAANTTFSQLITLEYHHQCSLQLKNGAVLECLVIAEDQDGNWTVITVDGDIAGYASEEVVSM